MKSSKLSNAGKSMGFRICHVYVEILLLLVTITPHLCKLLFNKGKRGKYLFNIKNPESLGIPGWLSGLAPAFGPGRDPGVPGSSPGIESRDRVPHQAQGMEPASPSSCVSASLSLYVYHK